MTPVALTKQYILDASGAPIGVILPIEDYRALVTPEARRAAEPERAAKSSLFGALCYLGGAVAPVEVIDATLTELWSAWDNQQPFLSESSHG